MIYEAADWGVVEISEPSEISTTPEYILLTWSRGGIVFNNGFGARIDFQGYCRYSTQGPLISHELEIWGAQSFASCRQRPGGSTICSSE
jgi:hypothetical protein